MEFLTLILGALLFLAVLTYRDWFPTILLIIMGQGSRTKDTGLSGKDSQYTHAIHTFFLKVDFKTHFY